ncbi:hypothetical protein QR97_21130 [Streptomyces sp. PBH53]|uniref:hypothetical protein n=1 Tax=Streptomyces TaxID=1883 RepID=UPI00065527BF|nr:hypothetical protein [Streptomyces sp. PBH53]AKN71956.1 hypothetical protein QR97_21130 [Streptomyces sp. PBH53]
MDDDSLLGLLFGLLLFPALLAVPAWLIAVIVKLGSVAMPGRRPDWRLDLVRWSAWMAGWAALVLYLLGAGAVAISVHESSSGADSSPAHECRDDFPPGVLVGQSGSFLPLRFDCVLADGSTRPSSPGYFWINILVLALGLAAVALGVLARTWADRRPEPRVPVTDPGSGDGPRPV